MVSQGWDPPIAWMGKIVELIKKDKIKQNTNKKLADFGKQIKPYKGILPDALIVIT